MFDSSLYSVRVQEKGRSGGEGCIGQRSVSIQTLDLVPAPHMLQHTAPRDVYHGHCQDMDTGDREQQVDIWTSLTILFHIVQIINPFLVVSISGHESWNLPFALPPVQQLIPECFVTSVMRTTRTKHFICYFFIYCLLGQVFV